MSYLVIDIGGTFTKYAIMDSDGKFYLRDKIFTVQDTQEHFIDMLVNIYNKNASGVEGIAISAAGIIDSDTGYMHTGGSVFCVSELDIANILKERCRIPVTVENDARCAALAEVWKGTLADCQNAIVVICGTAIGGAVILNRKVLCGKSHIAGEFSYILTDNCIDSEKTVAMTCGVPALIHMVACETDIPEGELDGEKIFSLADAGNTKVLECVRKYASRLAVQITNYQFMFDPERVAIGGGISAQPLFIELLEEELEKINKIFPNGHVHSLPVPQVTACRFFNDANLLGALYHHLTKVKEKSNVSG